VTVYRLFSAARFHSASAKPSAAKVTSRSAGVARPVPDRRDGKESEKRFKDASEFARALENGLTRAPPGRSAPCRRSIADRSVAAWQGLTFLFAAAFFVLLIVLLRLR